MKHLTIGFSQLKSWQAVYRQRLLLLIFPDTAYQLLNCEAKKQKAPFRRNEAPNQGHRVQEVLRYA
jgi:hypothetical protein